MRRREHSLLWLLLASIVVVAPLSQAFVVPRSTADTCVLYRSHHARLFSSSDNDDTGPKSIVSSKRIGGRKRRNDRPKENRKQPPQWLLLPLGLLTGLVVFASQFTGGESNYVYYSSTTYSSTIVQPDGRVESTERVNVQSNRPELVRDRQFVGDSEIQQELESMKKLEQSLFNEFF